MNAVSLILSRYWAGLWLGLWSLTASAVPLSPQAVPAELTPWIPWVLHDEQTLACPFLYHTEARACQWPGRLMVQADAKGGAFVQTWQLYAAGWVALPGDAQHWPQAVQSVQNPESDSKTPPQSAVVVEREGLPGVWLQAGSYQLSGHWDWDSLPAFLQLPADIGLVNFSLSGQLVELPEVDGNARLWLRRDGQAQAGETPEENSLTLRSYRRVVDEIPLQLITRLELEVSGQPRETLLNPLFSAADAPHWRPLTLDSALPARLEPDGRLRVQLRPGSWVITVSLRHLGTVTELQPTLLGEEETWVFEARHALRQVDVEGATSVDPQQTGLPAEWRRFPAYVLHPGDTLRLTEKRRGNPDPAPDQLQLARRYWLDFDGQGYSIQDQVHGTMSSGWRLNMAEPAQLGRVSVNGEDQFITRLDDASPRGIEVRHGQVNIQADSRIDSPLRTLPAVGWLHDFQVVSTELYLPPGWRLFHAEGADNVPQTWLKQWTLLDLFVVLITALVVATLWRKPWGVLALLTLLLIYHESQAPRWVWLHILACVALLRVLPPQRWFTRLVQLYRNGAVLLLIVLSVSFMVMQVRQSLYPQLAAGGGLSAHYDDDLSQLLEVSIGRHSKIVPAPVSEPAPEGAGFDNINQANSPVMQQEVMPPAPSTSVEEAIQDKENQIQDADSYTSASSSEYYTRKSQKEAKRKVSKQLIQIDPNARVQTGPGLPSWQWTPIHINWSGPVQAEQSVRLYLLSPVFNSLLGLLRALLLAALLGLLLFKIWGRGRDSEPRPDLDWSLPTAPTATLGGALLLLLSGLLLGVPQPVTAGGVEAPPSRGQWPDQALLDTLQARLTAPPDCLPACASLARLHVQASAEALRMHLEIQAVTPTAVPLPGSVGQWLAQQVWLNGQPANALRRDESGHLWLSVPAGVNQVQMLGQWPSRNQVQLVLPMAARKVTADVTGWQLEGLHRDGLSDTQLQFSRQLSAADGNGSLDQGALPALVQVERRLLLGLEWQVITQVRRLSPPGSAVVLAIPLLHGESVSSDRPRVENGKALINMAADETETEWVSVFEKQAELTLTAPSTEDWYETWQVDTSAIWHLEYQGLPVVLHQTEAGLWLPTWRPWPGESLVLTLHRPVGVSGQVLTIDSSRMQIEPGQRAIDTRIALRLRSSRGGEHSFTLPADAELQGLQINGVTQPLRQEGARLSLPITPGAQEVSLWYRQNQESRGRFTSTPLDLGVPSVNSHIEVTIPESRWVIMVGGPRLGPAVLFWGVLLVVALVSVGLARSGLTPLRFHEWFLLGSVISQVDILLTLVLAAWLLALGFRRQLVTATLNKWYFDGLQLALLALTLFALGTLVIAIEHGLLGRPEMYIVGNGSSANLLRWYQDRSVALLPTVWVWSLPLWLYRITMLAWALWLAFALLRWLRWGWSCFAAGELWKTLRTPRPVKS